MNTSGANTSGTGTTSPPVDLATGTAVTVVSVVEIDVASAGEPDVSVLDERERTVAARFAHPADRRRYVVAHVGLRVLLAGKLGIAADEVVIGRQACPSCGGAHGRPIVNGVRGLEVSLSSAGDAVLVATSPVVVGVDVERRHTDAVVDGLVPMLHPIERDELSAGPPAGRTTAFARLWCRKEAYLKALGTGLSRPLSADYLGDGQPDQRPPGWTVVDLDARDGYAAAVAVQAVGPVQVPMLASGGIARLALTVSSRSGIPTAPRVPPR